MCFTNDGNFGAFHGFSSQRWVLMWVWRVRSSPSVRQRRRDRSRKHRSLWPSHPASAYPRCLRITQQNRGRERDRVKPKLPKATLWLPPAGCERKLSQVGATLSAPSLVPQLGVPPVTRKWGPPEESSGRESWDAGATSSSVGHKQAWTA